LDKGLGPVSAAAFVGNFLVESERWTLDPKSKNGRGYFGIASWGTSQASGNRWGAFLTYAGEHKLNKDSLEAQLDFVWHELETDKAFVREELRRFDDIRHPTAAEISKAATVVGGDYEGALTNGVLQGQTWREYEAKFVLYEFWAAK
jgi:hypothetical protein